MLQASFFGMPDIDAPAGKCSCISGVHAILGVKKKGAGWLPKNMR
jgi:hypothetical protein